MAVRETVTVSSLAITQRIVPPGAPTDGQGSTEAIFTDGAGNPSPAEHYDIDAIKRPGPGTISIVDQQLLAVGGKTNLIIRYDGPKYAGPEIKSKVQRHFEMRQSCDAES